MIDNHERASEFNHLGQDLSLELVGVAEHVGSGEDRFSLVVQPDVGAMYVAIASEYLFVLRIPHNELPVWLVHRVELVDVACQSSTAACLAEGDLTKSSDFAHEIRALMRSEDVNVVSALACVTQKASAVQFFFQYLLVDRSDDFFEHLF